MSTKIIGLDSLKHIKSYVDRIKGNIKEELDAETKEYLEEGIKDASEAIYKDYDSKYKELTDAIARAEANGDSNLAALKLQLDELINNTNDKFVALDSLKTDLNKLNGEYKNLDIKYNSIFSPGQLDEVIRTALITETVITDDMVSVPNVFATKIVSLIANMGHINAGSIDAGTMRGSSIESTNTILTAPNPNKVGVGEPVWKIDNAGNGWFARGNIYWDVDGNVTFGPGVSLTWESIKDGNSKISGILDSYDEGVRNYVQQYVTENTQSAASRAELEQAQKDAQAAVDDLQTLLSGEIGTLRTDTEQQIKEAGEKVNTFIETQYANDMSALEGTIEATEKALRDAYAEGNLELIAELEKLQTELEWQKGKLLEESSNLSVAVGTVTGELTHLRDSALTKHNAEDLLSAALITQNEIGDDYVATPSLLAKKIVGLVATFGTVNASKIVGTKIQGYTVSSPTQIKDDEGNIVYEEDKYEYEVDKNGDPVPATDENGNILKNPNTGETIYKYATDAITGKKIPIPKELSEEDVAWQLNADGSGHVAERQIRWDYPRIEEGEYKGEIAYPDNVITDAAKREWRRDHVEVTFGPHVTIGWDKVEGGEVALNDAIADASASIRGDLNEWASDNNLSPIEQKNLKELYNNITKEYDQLIQLYNTCTSNKITVEGKDEYKTAYDNFVDAIKHHTRGIYDWENKISKEETITIMVNKSGGAGSADLPKDDSRRYENISNYYSAKEIFSSNLNNAVAENSATLAKDAAIKDAQKKVNDAKTSIGTDLANAEKRLNEAIATGKSDAIAEAQKAYTLAETANTAVGTLETAINKKIDGLDADSILSAGQLSLLAEAADIQGGKVTNDTLLKENVFAKNMVGLAGTFAEVQAEKIKGTTISGLNIQSAKIGTIDGVANKPLWQINNDGSGYLASGKIKFQTTAPYMTIDGIEVMRGINNAVGGGSTPSTGDQQVINTFGNFVANYIQADKIDVTQLNTTGWDSEGKPKEGAGTITIQDDFINVYGKDGNYPVRNVIKISGNDINDRPLDRTQTIPGKTLNATNSVTSFELPIHTKKISSFITGADAGRLYFPVSPLAYSGLSNYDIGSDAKTFTVTSEYAGIKADLNNAGSITISLDNGNTNSINTGIEFAANGYLYITTKDDTNSPAVALANGPFFDPEKDHYNTRLYVNTNYNGGVTISDLKIIYNSNILDNGCIKVGNYKIVPILRMSFGRFEPGDDTGSLNNIIDSYLKNISIESISVQYPALKFSTGDTYIDRGPQSRCDISPLGFRYWADKTKYVEFLKNGSFILRNGNNILAVDDKGIGINLNGDTANLQKITTKEFKFRLRNYDGKNYAAVKIPVLCLDGTFTAEDDS